MTLSTTGSIQKKYEYSDYGERNLDSKTEIINNEFGYNGEAHTVDGLQYLRARYYDPVTGVFISADSYRGEFSHPLSQNRYTYCNNNPYKYDDPTGHLPITGINKNTVAAYDSRATVKPKPPQKAIQKNVVVEDYRPSSAQEAHARNQQNAVSGTITLLGSTDKAPVKETVVPKEEAKATGEQESESIGTVTTIVTETHDNTQPYGVETYETQSTETKVVDVKDIAKGILSGVVMAGIGMLIAGALTIVGAATPVAAVATAVITGFSGAYVNAGVGALVENKSIEEYGRSQGYQTLKDYQNKLLKDAFIGAAIGATVAVVAAAVIYGSSLISNSVADDVANVVVNQSDETAAVVSQSADDFVQMNDEFAVVVDKADEVTEATEKSAETSQQGIFSDRNDSSKDIIQYEKLKSQYAADEIYNADRIGSALNTDPYHRSASYLSKEQLAKGRTNSIIGKDGKPYTLLQTKGQLNDSDGTFEYIINNLGQVTHQRFINGGIYTGFPNQVVPKGGY